MNINLVDLYFFISFLCCNKTCDGLKQKSYPAVPAFQILFNNWSIIKKKDKWDSCNFPICKMLRLKRVETLIPGLWMAWILIFTYWWKYVSTHRHIWHILHYMVIDQWSSFRPKALTRARKAPARSIRWRNLFIKHITRF